jgi:putative endonuclease
MFYVYIIQSRFDGSYYIGYTENLVRRIEQHNNGESIYTSKKMPWQMVYFEKFQTKTEAIRREKFLKRQKINLFIRN